jgi:hypothetical protein
MGTANRPHHGSLDMLHLQSTVYAARLSAVYSRAPHSRGPCPSAERTNCVHRPDNFCHVGRSADEHHEGLHVAPPPQERRVRLRLRVGVRHRIRVRVRIQCRSLSARPLASRSPLAPARDRARRRARTCVARLGPSLDRVPGCVRGRDSGAVGEGLGSRFARRPPRRPVRPDSSLVSMSDATRFILNRVIVFGPKIGRPILGGVRFVLMWAALR